MSGRHCVGVVPIPCLPVFASYIMGHVVVHGCETPIESFVVHTLSIDPAGPDYEERIAPFLIFLSNVPIPRYKPTLP